VPFDVREVDARLPQGGLARGALHEVAGGGVGAVRLFMPASHHLLSKP
jgi:protein ImuA